MTIERGSRQWAIFIDIALLVVTLIYLFASDRGRASPGESKNPPRFLLGDCYSAEDPKAAGADSFPAMCMRGSLFTEAMIGTDSAHENIWLAGTRGYAGVHASTWLSVHAAGHFIRAENSRFGSEFSRQIDVDFLTINLGNPALHRWRLIGGRPLIPFGIGDSPIMESFQLLGASRFWSGQDSGAVGIYDNLADFQLEVAALSSAPRDNEKPQAQKYQGEKYQGRVGNDAAALRMSYDIPALDGSRLVISAYGDRLSERRVGFAFLNVSVKGDVTHFEFVRVYQFENEKFGDPEQLLRLAYLGALRGGSRWAVQYDDVRRKYRLGVLGQDYTFRANTSVRLGIGYRKSESDDVDSRWFLAGGLLWSL